MILKGITTHNLKNIDFYSNKKELIGIYGVSGGGKSSLANHTIHVLCSNAFASLENGSIDNNHYILESYKDLLPCIAIKQHNANSNPRSSIYSYLNFSSLISSGCKIDYGLLKLNRPDNECPQCQGRGVAFVLDETKLINYHEPLDKIPLLPFKECSCGNDSLANLFLMVCKHYGIDTSNTLDSLNKKVLDLLLYGEDGNSFSIKYKHNKRQKTRTMRYVGIFPYMERLLQSNKISMHKEALKYCKEQPCPHCSGSKINIAKYKSVYIGNISFYDFLTKSFCELLGLMDKNNKSLSKIYKLIESSVMLGIGYLTLSRSIPTLSGGEIQKLNFANLMCCEMSNLLIIIDELSTGLHVCDFSNIMEAIETLKENNTIILVEHNPYFLKHCDRLIKLGPVGGKSGGYIVENTLDMPSVGHTKGKAWEEFLYFKNITIHNITNQDITIPAHALSAIVGKSGSGKSSLAHYISSCADTIYVSQKHLKGNIRSNISTYLEVSTPIAKYFAKHFNKDEKYFSNSDDGCIACAQCGGNGTIKYERSFESAIYIDCPQCNGELFNEKADDFKIDGASIRDIYTRELGSMQGSNIPRLKKIGILAKQLSLDYLSLHRKINTLSGGELKRLKILKSMLHRLENKVLIIDEPSAGLDIQNAINVFNAIRQIKTKATIIIEHNPHIFFLADYIVEIGPGSGSEGGNIIFSGSPQRYYEKKWVEMAQYF